MVVVSPVFPVDVYSRLVEVVTSNHKHPPYQTYQSQHQS